MRIQSIQCRHCGYDGVDLSDRFCPSCGEALLVCSHCRKAVRQFEPDQLKFCPLCGAIWAVRGVAQPDSSGTNYEQIFAQWLLSKKAIAEIKRKNISFNELLVGSLYQSGLSENTRKRILLLRMDIPRALAIVSDALLYEFRNMQFPPGTLRNFYIKEWNLPIGMANILARNDILPVAALTYHRNTFLLMCGAGEKNVDLILKGRIYFLENFQSKYLHLD